MTKRRVLIVDDDHDSGQMLRTLLAFSGHEARWAGDGRRALDEARTFLPDAAFLDISLPGMDGYELARELRRIPSLDGMTLVATTGFSDQDARQRARQAGFNHFLVKPLDLDEINRLLASPAG